MHGFQFGILVAGLCLSMPSSGATKPDAHASQGISMNPSHWHAVGEKPDVQYVLKEGFRGGIYCLEIRRSCPERAVFRDGTIEFDIKPLAEDIPGIRSVNVMHITLRSSTFAASRIAGPRMTAYSTAR